MYFSHLSYIEYLLIYLTKRRLDNLNAFLDCLFTGMNGNITLLFLLSYVKKMGSNLTLYVIGVEN